MKIIIMDTYIYIYMYKLNIFDSMDNSQVNINYHKRAKINIIKFIKVLELSVNKYVCVYLLNK